MSNFVVLFDYGSVRRGRGNAFPPHTNRLKLRGGTFGFLRDKRGGALGGEFEGSYYNKNYRGQLNCNLTARRVTERRPFLIMNTKRGRNKPLPQLGDYQNFILLLAGAVQGGYPERKP